MQTLVAVDAGAATRALHAYWQAGGVLEVRVFAFDEAVSIDEHHELAMTAIMSSLDPNAHANSGTARRKPITVHEFLGPFYDRQYRVLRHEVPGFSEALASGGRMKIGDAEFMTHGLADAFF